MGCQNRFGHAAVPDAVFDYSDRGFKRNHVSHADVDGPALTIRFDNRADDILDVVDEVRVRFGFHRFDLADQSVFSDANCRSSQDES